MWVFKKTFFKNTIIVFICSIIAAMPFLAISEKTEAALDSGYIIENFHIDVNLTDANVYEIRQKIDVNFLESSRGIFLHIPYLLNVDLPGADESRYRAKIRDIKVPGYETDIYTENRNKVIRIGDPDIWLDGRYQYEISYTYTTGPDHSGLADFLYFNLLGPQWTTNILNFSFTIQMPNEFDSQDINFTTGYYGSENNEAVDYKVDGKTISGSVPEGLNAFEAVTVYLELPEGYFTEARYNGFLDFTTIGISILALAFIIILYMRLGRDRPVPETVEFYAPNGIDPAHAGYVADGMADNKDLIALIMYWADQGYINIIEQNKKISLKKLQDLPADKPVYQLTIFKGLFKKGDHIELDSLKETFYTTLQTAKNQLKGAHQHNTFEQKSSHAQIAGIFICFLPLIVSFARTFFVGLLEDADALIITSIINAIVMLSGILFLIYTRLKWKLKSKAGKIISVIIPSILMLNFQFTSAMTILSSSLDPYKSSLIAAFSSLVIVPFVILMNRKTIEGEKLFARLMGFRSFMQRAEKQRIETLVNDNPAYFYNVLPYAYVLDVTNKWAKQFEGIAIQPPTWYYTDTMTTFTALHFANQMNRAATQMNTVMISQPPSSSGGGSGSFGGGGGGFSGGGFGGGGGGRW